MKYRFFHIGTSFGRYTSDANPGGDNVYFGGGEYDNDSEALKQAYDYADMHQKTLSLVTCEPDERIVWSLKK